MLKRSMIAAILALSGFVFAQPPTSNLKPFERLCFVNISPSGIINQEWASQIDREVRNAARAAEVRLSTLIECTRNPAKTLYLGVWLEASNSNDGSRIKYLFRVNALLRQVEVAGVGSLEIVPVWEVHTFGEVRREGFTQEEVWAMTRGLLDKFFQAWKSTRTR